MKIQMKDQAILHRQTHRFALASMFTALVFLLTFTPIGFINLVLIKATIIHIPVIIGSLMLGPKIGALLGFMFGLASFLNNTLFPTSLLSFAFSPLVPVPGSDGGSIWALAVCFVPRTLVGVVPYFVEKLVSRIMHEDAMTLPSLFAAGLSGGLTNTLLVMHLIYLLFSDAYSAKTGIAIEAVYAAVVGVITMQGLPESIVAGIIVALIVKPVCAAISRRRSAR